MSVRWTKRGKGFSAREIAAFAPSMSGQDIADTLRHVGSKHTFDGLVQEVEHFAKEILAATKVDDGAERQFEEDSIEDYAQQLVDLIRVVRHHCARGNPDLAARYAVRLGWLASECALKFEWESFALSGEKRRADLKQSSDAENAQRRQARNVKAERCQSEAEKIWKLRPELSKSAIARIVKANLKLPDKIDTITRLIEKPRTAG